MQDPFQNFERRSIVRAPGYEDDWGRPIRQTEIVSQWHTINEEFAELKQGGWNFMAVIERPDGLWEWQFYRRKQ
jgi:hypothetical protein